MTTPLTPPDPERGTLESAEEFAQRKLTHHESWVICDVISLLRERDVQIRAQALEEAAQIACDSMRKSQGYSLGQAAIIAGDIAERIRALIHHQEPTS